MSKLPTISLATLVVGSVVFSGCAVASVVSANYQKREPQASAPMQVNKADRYTSNIQVGRYATMLSSPTQGERNPLLANSAFSFAPRIATISDALHQVLDGTGYHLAKDASFHLKATLKKPLPATQRHIKSQSIKATLLQLVGSDVYYASVDPVSRAVNFCLIGHPCNVKKTSTKVSVRVITKVVALPAIDKFLERTNFTIRTALPLHFKETRKQLIKAIVARNHAQKLYFGFNDQDKIVGVAGSQHEADALAENPRQVFYAQHGQSLKDTLLRWASYSNTHIFFNTKKNLLIEADSVFFGAFKSRHGSLSGLLQAVNSSGVALRAQFRANNTLIIKDRHYNSLFLTPESHNAP